MEDFVLVAVVDRYLDTVKEIRKYVKLNAP